MENIYHKAALLATAMTQTFCAGAFSLPGGDNSFNGPAGLRLPPLASAGADREVQRGTPTYLSAQGSYHPQGHSFNFSWRQLGGELVQVSNPGAVQPLFVAPLEEQTLTFELTASSPETGLSTTDIVQIVVSNAPERVAPLTNIGADRFLEQNEFPLPPDDLHEWQSITAEDMSLAYADNATPSPVTIWRGDRLQDGLRSAPDYLLLFAFDERLRGLAAPVADLNTSSTVQATDVIDLDGSNSSDPNGNGIRYRWRQLEGAPLDLVNAPQKSSVSLKAPARAQRLRFRLSVSDGLLESAPADATITIMPLEGTVENRLPPQPDRRSHEANIVFLDANPLASSGDPFSYVWKQTAGPSTILNIREGSAGRIMSFVTPTKGELGFLVTSLDQNDVESRPAVARVMVVAKEENEAPTITLCSNRNSVGILASKVTVTALIQDPEADLISSIVWNSKPSSDGELQEVDVIQNEQLCGSIATVSDRPSLVVRQALINLEPNTNRIEGEVISIDLQACDNLGACQDTTLELQIAPGT